MGECEHKLIFRYANGYVCSECGLKVPFKSEPIWPKTFKKMLEAKNEVKNSKLTSICPYLNPSPNRRRKRLKKIGGVPIAGRGFKQSSMANSPVSYIAERCSRWEAVSTRVS